MIFLADEIDVLIAALIAKRADMLPHQKLAQHCGRQTLVRQLHNSTITESAIQRSGIDFVNELFIEGGSPSN